MINKKKKNGEEPIQIPVKRVNEQEQEMMQSIVQTKPIHFKNDDEILSDISKSKVESKASEQSRM